MTLCCFSEDIVEKDIPAEFRSEAEDRRQELIEHVPNVDETLDQMYLGMLLHNLVSLWLFNY